VPDVRWERGEAQVRIWDAVPPSKLCRQHLLGEHRELHAIWRIITGERSGSPYEHHPEVKRWMTDDGINALFNRHYTLAYEMKHRGYNHHSPISLDSASSIVHWPEPWDDQLAALRAKGCGCEV